MGPGYDQDVPVRDDGGGRERAATCHCQGHRLAVVIGPGDNDAIGAALAWIRGLGVVQHRVWFPTGSTSNSPSVSAPHVPAAGGGWERFQVARGHRHVPGRTTQLVATWNDCCFYEEVIVVAHGNQTSLGTFLASHLGTLLETRPVRRLALWSCNAASEFYPHFHGGGRRFEKLCGFLVPKACPCNCDLARCAGRCRDPDGGTAPTYRCPSTAEPTTLYLAAWYAAGGKDHASPLGIRSRRRRRPGPDLARRPDARGHDLGRRARPAGGSHHGRRRTRGLPRGPRPRRPRPRGPRPPD